MNNNPNNNNCKNNYNINNNNNNYSNPKENRKEIKQTLNEAKKITKNANIYMSSIAGIASPYSNPTSSPQYKASKEYLLHTINSKNINNPSTIKEEDKEPKDNSIEEENEDNDEEEEEEGIYTLDYINKQIDRYTKKQEKFDKEVKKNLALSKQYPNKKDEYKDEAVRALKKKKFYAKALERYENRKLKLDLKNLDKEFEAQKKELKKLTRDFKKKVALVTRGEDYDDNNEDEVGDDVNEILDQVDIDEKTLNEQYENIICRPEVKEANKNLNLFKFIFQEE